MRKTEMEEKWLDHDGCRIRYVDEGAGPAILFLHGLGGKIEDNDLCFPYLTDRFRVVAMDCPGSGFSDKPDREYSIDYLVDFSVEFAARLGLEEYFVCGGSQGGLQTLLCCLRAPERIPKAAVYSPAGVWPPRPAAAKIFSVLPPSAVKLFFQFTSLFWNSPTHPEYWRSRKSSLEFIDYAAREPGFGRHVFGCLESVLGRDQRERFKDITTPVLVLWGAHDFGMPIAQGRELVEILPDARLIEVPRTGHNIPCEKPEFFAKKVSEFFLG